MNTIYSQNIASYKWKNRLLLVLTENTNNTIYKAQIKELENNEKEFEERKLIIYKINKDLYNIGLKENAHWLKSNQLYKAYKKTNTPFEVLLIGLDGSIKVRETDLITCDELFAIIDVMPMRKAEINGN
jgi:hypothetical protein